jgi:alkanesulfonate monooxygenase SsuD/methylene tetrahydromethanopterin reductase-like flavin-dependent oxidoreductase (luciferase family)
VKLGAVFWMQGAKWPALRDGWQAAGRAGVDSLWTEDHLLADAGDWRQPKFEGWAALAALAPLTQTPRVGVLVTAVAFRNPGHVAKLATTLDHITNGRLVLGMGAGQLQREHEAFGLDFGATPGARLDRLDEALGLIRRLLDGELVTHHGRYYDFVDALCEPRPIQKRIPFMIGGSGPKKTLGIVARHADEWNKSGGSPEVVAQSLDVLQERCAEVGRDYRTIKKSVMVWMHIRDGAEDAMDVHRAIRVAAGFPPTTDRGVLSLPTTAGTIEQVAGAIRAYQSVGIDELLLQMHEPFDLETLRRLPELRAHLAAS